MFSKHFGDLHEAFKTIVYSSQTNEFEESEAMGRVVEMLTALKNSGGIAYVVGNGGSAGIASHFSTDLLKALRIPSSTLYDSSLMTCLSNDYGYDQVFSYPLEHVLKPQDLLIAISSSGKSPNIIQAVKVAHQKKTPVITFSGFSIQNPLRLLGDLNFWVDRSHYGFVEMLHFILLHTIVDLWNHHPQEQVREYARILGSQTAK